MNKYELAVEALGASGRMVDASKLDYSRRYPTHIVVFNGNVCTEEGKIWFGDIDVTLDKDKLEILADAIGKKIYVLYEMDGRFDNEGTPQLDRAVYITGEGHYG